MQSGLGKTDKWILEFETKDPIKNPLMGWESSLDTLTEIKLEFLQKIWLLIMLKLSLIHIRPCRRRG